MPSCSATSSAPALSGFTGTPSTCPRTTLNGTSGKKWLMTFFVSASGLLESTASFKPRSAKACNSSGMPS